MAKYDDFKDPIEIPQFYFTRDMYDIYRDTLQTDEQKGQFLDLIAYWSLFNIIDIEKAKSVEPCVADAFNRCVFIMYSGINKYRHDYFNGSKGGRPIRRTLPQINFEEENRQRGIK